MSVCPRMRGLERVRLAAHRTIAMKRGGGSRKKPHDLVTELGVVLKQEAMATSLRTRSPPCSPRWACHLRPYRTSILNFVGIAQVESAPGFQHRGRAEVLHQRAHRHEITDFQFPGRSEGGCPAQLSTSLAAHRSALESLGAAGGLALERPYRGGPPGRSPNRPRRDNHHLRYQRGIALPFAFASPAPGSRVRRFHQVTDERLKPLGAKQRRGRASHLTYF